MSPPLSPKALYHAIPQALDDTGEATLRDEEEQEQDELAALDPPQALVDPRISWIYFLLGCSVLLPWNGMYLFGVIPVDCALGFTVSLVMITAIPFFLSRLSNSPLKSTFSSYLSTSFTVAGFVFLAHATAASRRVSRFVITYSEAF